METIIIQRAIIISFIVIAIWCCCLEGMIFGKIRDLNIPEWLEEPIFSCPVCMNFWHGTVLYWVIFHSSWQEWLLVTWVGMGIATIFVKMKKN